MEDLELLSFNIISAVGTAKSRYVQAMYLAEKGDFDEARAKIKEGEESFVKGHEAHASLIQKEACGEKTVPTIQWHTARPYNQWAIHRRRVHEMLHISPKALFSHP